MPMIHCRSIFFAITQSRPSRSEMYPSVFCPWENCPPLLSFRVTPEWGYSAADGYFQVVPVYRANPLRNQAQDLLLCVMCRDEMLVCQSHFAPMREASQCVDQTVAGRIPEKQGQGLWVSGGFEFPTSRSSIMWANPFLVWGQFLVCPTGSLTVTKQRSAHMLQEHGGWPGTSAPTLKTKEKGQNFHHMKATKLLKM